MKYVDNKWVLKFTTILNLDLSFPEKWENILY